MITINGMDETPHAPQTPEEKTEQQPQSEIPQPVSKPKKLKRNSILLVIAILVVGVGAYFLLKAQMMPADDTVNEPQPPIGPTQQITNFDECKAAGYPIMESFPEQCAANGQTFVNERQAAGGLYHTEESGKKAFSMTIPDGWTVVKPLDQDSFYVMGMKQPEIKPGTDPQIDETESFGTDSPSVFSVVKFNDGFDDVYTQGTAKEFNVGKAEDMLKGKKYTYIIEKDEIQGIGTERFKGDRDYTYVLETPDGGVIVASYSVYGSDPKNLVETIDKVIQSIQVPKS